jgi:hypothetical protein
MPRRSVPENLLVKARVFHAAQSTKPNGFSHAKPGSAGDAKDSENEDATNGETLKRIQGYFQEFAARLGGSVYKGGILAIATNSAEAAADWVPALNTLACTAGITGKGGVQPNFKVTETRQGKTWIIWW